MCTVHQRCLRVHRGRGRSVAQASLAKKKRENKTNSRRKTKKFEIFVLFGQSLEICHAVLTSSLLLLLLMRKLVEVLGCSHQPQH